MSTFVSLALIPRDGFFCKDGRDWFASASGRGHGLDWPLPSTLLGCLRSAWGLAREAKMHARFNATEWRANTLPMRLGSSVALRRPHASGGMVWAQEHRVWPVPRDVLWREQRDEFSRLVPEPPRCKTLGRDDDEAREALWVPHVERTGKPLPPPRWWNEADFVSWLAGEHVATKPTSTLSLERRRLAHVEIMPTTLTSRDGALYSHDVIETLQASAEWAIGAQVSFPDTTRPSMARLGSDGRIISIEEAHGELFATPSRISEAFAEPRSGLRLIAVSPASFPDGWIFPGFTRYGHEFRGLLPGVEGDLVLRAAYVPRPLPVSGWDMAANNGAGAPKKGTQMIAPGSVFFFDRHDGNAFDARQVAALWLSAHGDRTEEGFGRFVPGVWDRAASK